MFRFRLQRVLDLRARTERDAATALTSAQDAATASRDAQAALERARAELAAQLCVGMNAQDGTAAPGTTAAALSVGELRNLGFLLDRLDTRVSEAAQATDAAERVVDEREEALRTAFRDRRTLDRLRERHQEQWQEAATAADRQLMDDIALARFTQSAASASGAAGAS